MMKADVDSPDSYENEWHILRKSLDQRLDILLPSGHVSDRICYAMRDGTLRSGKRIRPLLLLLMARDFGCDVSQSGIMDLACSVEMVHAASLILDDIPSMDNALMRRGQPTIHHQYGESTAILTAVALLSRAFGVIAQAKSLTAHCKNLAAAELSAAIGAEGLVQGQFRDLTEGNNRERTPASILETNVLKTSTLFDASLQMAAVASEAAPAVRETLHCFARELGQAFQLLDDLCDSQNNTGKDQNQDANKVTLVAVLGSAVVRERFCRHLCCADEYLCFASHPGSTTRRFMHSWFNQQLKIFGWQRLSSQIPFPPEEQWNTCS